MALSAIQSSGLHELARLSHSLRRHPHTVRRLIERRLSVSGSGTSFFLQVGIDDLAQKSASGLTSEVVYSVLLKMFQIVERLKTFLPAGYTGHVVCDEASVIGPVIDKLPPGGILRVGLLVSSLTGLALFFGQDILASGLSDGNTGINS